MENITIGIISREKKFNYVYDEYIDKNLSNKASSLDGEYWLMLVSIFESINDSIFDMNLSKNLKEDCILRLVNAQENEIPIFEAMEQDIEEFVDELIHEKYTNTKKQKQLKLLYTVSVGVFMSLFIELPSLIYQLLTGNWIGLKFNQPLYLYNFSLLFISIFIYSPLMKKLKIKIHKKNKKFFTPICYVINILICICTIAVFYYLYKKMTFIFYINMWLYILIIIASVVMAIQIKKKII